jgi:hypothetical protein
VTGVVAYLALVVAIPALILGHQGQDFPPFRWLRAARVRRGIHAPVSRPQGPVRLPRHLRTAPEPSQPPSRPAPHWAHTDTEEAA